MTHARNACLLVLLAALLILGACARSRAAPATDAAPSTREGRDSVFVEVVNDNYYDVRMHVIYPGGARHLVGTIAGNSRQVAVAIPWEPRALVIEVALIVGAGVYQSTPLDVTAGEVVEVRIPPNLDVSVFFRRVRK
jgi:hypothetical protein